MKSRTKFAAIIFGSLVLLGGCNRDNSADSQNPQPAQQQQGSQNQTPPQPNNQPGAQPQQTNPQ